MTTKLKDMKKVIVVLFIIGFLILVLDLMLCFAAVSIPAIGADATYQLVVSLVFLSGLFCISSAVVLAMVAVLLGKYDNDM